MDGFNGQSENKKWRIWGSTLTAKRAIYIYTYIYYVYIWLCDVNIMGIGEGRERERYNIYIYIYYIKFINGSIANVQNPCGLKIICGFCCAIFWG